MRVPEKKKIDIANWMFRYDRIKCKVGDIYESLIITRLFRIDGIGNTYFDAICSCGRKRTSSLGEWGTAKNCGDRKSHPSSCYYPIEKHKTRILNCWEDMWGRCYDKKDRSYADYGGRGIVICEEWYNPKIDRIIYKMNFANWCLSTGIQPYLTIDRKDVNGPYCPENCRWATRKQQAANRRNSFYIEAFGERKSAPDWAADPRCSVGCINLRDRVKKGWSPEEAITRGFVYIRNKR